MMEKVDEIIKEKKHSKDSEEKKIRDQFLIDRGYFEKEYDPNLEMARPNVSRDENGVFLKVPVEVTVDEWDKICSYEGVNSKTLLSKAEEKKNQNIISKALRILAFVVYAFGLLLNLRLKLQGQFYNWESFVLSLMSYVISGTFLLGLSEIIRLLNNIDRKIK